jgi:hypothetical protein
MDNKKIYLPIYYRLIMIVCGLFGLFCLLFSLLTINNDEDIMLLFIFGIVSSIIFPLTVLIFVSYTFLDNKIIIKYPFIKAKECIKNDIIGYILQATTEDVTFRIYTDKKIFSIIVNGKKIRNKINELMYEYDEIIKRRNKEELENTGIFIKINKRKYIKIYPDYLELMIKENKERYFHKDLTLKKINHYVIKLLTKDNKKINFNIYQCRGRFGLFEYFKNYKWNQQ